MLEFMVPFLLGAAIGIFLYRFTYVPKGTLKIDHSNPEKDVYRFEIDNLDELSKMSRITLKIDNAAKLSQE